MKKNHALIYSLYLFLIFGSATALSGPQEMEVEKNKEVLRNKGFEVEEGMDLRGKDLSGKSFSLKLWKNSNFRGTNFSDTRFGHSQWENIDARDANFKDANFTGTTFVEVDFRGADLRGVYLAATKFVRCDFRGAKLGDWFNWRKMIWEGYGLKYMELEGVKVNRKEARILRSYGHHEGLRIGFVIVDRVICRDAFSKLSSRLRKSLPY